MVLFMIKEDKMCFKTHHSTSNMIIVIKLTNDYDRKYILVSCKILKTIILILLQHDNI